jgi:hypothetical protein
MNGIDLDLDDDKPSPATDFASKEPMPNIWTISEPANHKHDDTGSNDDSQSSQRPSPPASVPQDDSYDRSYADNSNDDEELEKPSFLRRLTKRKKDQNQG